MGTAMIGRVFLVAALLYGYGDAAFDGHRPASLDRPLRNFRSAVDRVAIEAQRTLVALDNSAQIIPQLPMIGAKLRVLGAALAPG